MASGAGLDDRVTQVFGALGQAVVLPKGLALQVQAQGMVPRYVTEFLLAQRPATEAVAAIRDYLEQHHPLPRDRNLWRHRLVQKRAMRIVDRLDVAVDVETGQHVAKITSLGLTCRIASELVGSHPGLLSGGMWGRIDLVWDPVGDDVPATAVLDFRPVQVQARLDQYLEGRHYFTADEWIDLLLTSAGYEPVAVTDGLDAQAALRCKLLMLMRLAPLAESSLHTLELGPKNTGKTYMARNISPDAFVISGGAVTPANLFVHLTTGVPGLLAQRRVVAFDEVARVRLGSPEMVAALKDFLESGQFTRGRYEFASDCSVVLLGNIDVESGMPSPRYRHLCEPLPQELRDSAFLDRLHAYLPGWELPKLGPDSFARGVGFVSDYFGEVLARLRSLPFDAHYREMVDPYPLLPGMTRRDAVAVERVARALLKLVFPTGSAHTDDNVVEAILSMAGELRQRVHDQLCRIAPGEFPPRAVGFAGVPSSPARDLAHKGQTPVRIGASPGEALFLDREVAAEEGGGKVLQVEASVLATGRGLKLQGRLGPDAAEAVRIAYSYIVANARALRLEPHAVTERAIALQVSLGAVVDGRTLALPAFLAMMSALRREPYRLPVAALGSSSLHGRLQMPDDVVARIGALQDLDPGMLVLPGLSPGAEEKVRELLRGWKVVVVGDLGSVVRNLSL